MNKTVKSLLLAGTSCSLASAFITTANAAVLEDEITEFFKDGKVNIDMRARFEYVNAGGTDVDGYSLRTRLGYTTGGYKGFKASIEMEDLSFVDNSNRPGLDVPTTELNQFWLSYVHEDIGAFKVGRQVYTLDDHRFIGHVGWRQNIQTFDAATAHFNFTDSSALKLGYITKANRINNTTANLDGFTINGGYKFHESINLTAFAYLLEFDASALRSSDTYGFRATGTIPIDEFKIKYAGSYAQQFDNDGSPAGTDFDLGYYAFDVAGSFKGFSVGVGLEVLEGDGTVGFSTPLATVHKFNGWADVFAGRSLGLAGGLPQGLEDYYFKIGYKIPVGKGIPITAVYHNFQTENNSVDVGTEIDLVAKYSINKYLTVVSKYAYFDSDTATNPYFGAASSTLYTLELNFKY